MPQVDPALKAEKAEIQDLLEANALMVDELEAQIARAEAADTDTTAFKELLADQKQKKDALKVELAEVKERIKAAREAAQGRDLAARQAASTSLSGKRKNKA